MSEPPRSSYVVTVESDLARWAAASAKASTVERFLAASVALAIADELDGGPVTVQVGDCEITLVASSGCDA